MNSSGHVRFKLLVASLALLVSSQWLNPTYAAQDRALSIVLSTSDKDGLLDQGEPVVITAKIQNRSDSLFDGQIEWIIHTVAFKPTQVKPGEIHIEAGESATLTYEMVHSVPGFSDVECKVVNEESKTTHSRRIRIGCLPERVTAPLTRQPDFDSFWSDSLAELQSIRPEFKVAAVPARSNDAIDVYEVTMRSHGKVRVRGWLEVPRSKGPHPVVIRVPGYAGNMRPLGKWDDISVFSFNPRAHGNSQDDIPGKPVDYWVRGLDDKKTYYYRGAYLDCVRAVDFIASRSDVDQDRIAIWGGSQGGGFAFATAALDPRIDLCVADIPFLCDWVDYFALTQWPEVDGWIDAQESRTWDSTLRTMSYFDTMNLAGRIRCKTLMGVGLQDKVCPPSTIFAAFNRIPGEKKYRIYHDRGHGLNRDHYSWVWQQIREGFQLE